MSALYQPRPILSSQRYSPAPEYMDSRRSIHGDRLPLRESTGNVQPHGLGGIVSCYDGSVALSPPLTSNIPAPIVPSQSFDCLYRNQAPRHQVPPPLQPQHHPQQQPSRYRRRPRNEVNPLYFWPAFRQYRNRQAHKDTQKDKGGVWRRPELEDAFVDAVLLMPHMGRRKFSMGGKLHGRNMLISEYIFVICVAVLGSKEIFRIDNSNDSIEQMGRKQVSSHMQVVKKFFEDLRCFHFLFPAEEKKEPGTTNSDDFYEEEEQESFKSNPVLTALAEGRVPDVKPNYEYFSELLTLQSSIMVRPKTCEVFVSSPDIQIRDDVAYDGHDSPLDQASFPHLNKYMNCDDKPNVLGKDVLLHEYTRSLDRSTSACVKTVTRRWQKDAPALHDMLDLPTRDDQCLLLEMCATLELHEQAKFPSGSELTGFVEVAITQPGLQNHRWKCITKLTRPAELRSEDSQPEVYTNDSGIHHRGCSDRRPDCDCPARPRQDIHVPFPAVEWASILSMAVQYPDVEHQRKKDKRGKHGDCDGKKSSDLDRGAGSKRKRSEDEGDAASWSRRELTGSDLICRVAMYQELWSCAPDSNQWKRQAIVFWRFNTTNQWYKYNPVFRPAGTTWRWLTINDPMSRYHQQRALVYPSSLVRDSVMSPTPSVGQHLTAAMNETLGHAWDGSGGVGGLSHVTAGGTNGMGIFDSFPGGLATPPPTASLHGSYSAHGSFDAGSGVSGFLPSTCGGDSQPSALAQSHAYFDGTQAVTTTFDDVKPMAAVVNNPYMSSGPGSIDLSGQLVYDNTGVQSQADPAAAHHGGLHGWDMSTLDGWATGTAAAAPKIDHHAAAGLWNPVHWGHTPSTATPGADNTSTTVTGQDGSPRAFKRRRPDGIGHMPVTAGW